MYFLVALVLVYVDVIVMSSAYAMTWPIWLNPFATVLFNVCSAVTVVLCFAPVLRGCGCYYVRQKTLLQCLQLLRGGIWVCMRCPCLCVCCLCFGMGTMFAKFHVWCIMFSLSAVLNRLMRNTSPRGLMCFRCLIFSLSWPCELLFLLCFIASSTRGVVGVMFYPCMVCVTLSMELYVLCVACLIVFINCSVKQLAILVFNTVYVDLQYDYISLTLCWMCVCKGRARLLWWRQCWCSSRGMCGCGERGRVII